MKNKWLSLVLFLTNQVYSRKELVISKLGFSAIVNILWLINLELLLAIVSLPLYFTLKPQKVTAYFEEQGSYAKVNFDYSLRRILTLTGVAIVATLWVVKLLIIAFFPLFHGPLQLYYVSGLQPVDVLSQNLITTETGIQTARIMGSLPKPVLVEVRKVSGGDYTFFGTGQPNSTVVLLLSDISTVVYTAPIDEHGAWQIEQDQKTFRLNEGNHSVNLFGYDSKLGVRSETAPTQYFKVTASWFDYLVTNLDVLINWSIIVIILFGIFLIFLTI